MENISAKARALRVSQLYDQAVSLPKKLIEKDNEYPFYEGNVGNPNTEGNQSRYVKIYEMEGLMLDVRSYIKLSYGKESEYFKWVHNIYFTQESKGFISTYLDGMNDQWQKGRIELIQLLTNIQSEENERANLEKLMNKKLLTLPDAAFGCGFIISMLTIWAGSDEIFGSIFNLSNLLAVRILLSLGCFLLLAIIIAKEKWKELLVTGLIAVVSPLFPLVKSQPQSVPTPLKVDTTVQTIKPAQNLEIKTLKTKP